MAACGPPTTFEDRMARHALANQLRLLPGVYNFLVFGEFAPPPYRAVSSVLLPTHLPMIIVVEIGSFP